MQDKKNNSSAQLLDKELGAARLELEFNPASHGMMPLSIDLLAAGEPCPADLYLPLYHREEKRIEMNMACAKGDLFRETWRRRLVKAEQTQVYVLKTQTPALNDYFDNVAGNMLADSDKPMRKRAKLVQELAEYNMRSLFESSEGDGGRVEDTVNRAQSMVQHLSRNPQVLFNLSAMVQGDYTVYAHAANVCIIAMAFGRFLALSELTVQALGVGGLLHDVGMAKLPTYIVRSTGPRTHNQEQLFRTHCLAGYQMLLPVGAISYDALMIVRQHHENSDGTGFPESLKGDRITRQARIIHLVDAYDTLTSPYPWQKALSPMNAAQYMVENAARFGLDLMPPFLRFLAGSTVTE